MNAQQLKNAILQDLYSAKEGWKIKELKDVVADSCPISYGIVQQGDHVDGGVPVVRPVDLHTKYVGKVNLKCTSKDISDSYKRTILNGNEVLLCVRGTTGIVALATEELKGCNVNRGIVPLYFGDDVDRLFIYYQLQAPFIQEVIEENTMGSALKQINIKDLRVLRLLVPPLAEQKRIVEKIEELLPKVEEYGKAQDELNELNEELPEKLKKSILQEAIEGRLVSQDPNDEPASVLLQKIREEKQQLVKEGKLKKKDLEEKPISEDEIPFEIPECWEWVRLKTISSKLVDGDHNPPSGQPNDLGFYMLSSKNIIHDRVKIDDVRFLSYDDWKKCNERTNLMKGDVLLTTVATLGRSCVYENDVPYCFQRSVSIISTYIYNYYLKYCFDSPYYQSLINDKATGTAQRGFYINQLQESVIPLPPLAEQHRIVEKIEQLLGEIDKLK